MLFLNICEVFKASVTLKKELNSSSRYYLKYFFNFSFKYLVNFRDLSLGCQIKKIINNHKINER